MSAGEAFILVFLGAAGVYGEFIRPGRVIPGLAGSLMAITGIHGLAGMRLTAAGIVLIGLGTALFLVEAFWRIDFPAGMAATISLTLGFSMLIRPPARLSPALTIPACIVFGTVTIFLCRQAKRARRNKWQELKDGTPIANTWNFPETKP